jgi:dimethylargininase
VGRFTHAILRRPASNLADGETTANLGKPIFAKVEQQYEQYCDALRRCGVQLTILDADPDFPDSTFVEDPAVLTAKRAIFTRPGATSRAGEVARIRGAIELHFAKIGENRIGEIKAPGTLDGGDICEAGDHFFIGITHRTNEEGARQFAALVQQDGYTASTVDIRTTRVLHLKSGAAYLDGGHLLVMEEWAGRPEFKGYDLITVAPEETYAGNCIQVNEHVLLAAGFPKLERDIEQRGYKVMPLEMSEFEKMDGGLSCLSLRW